MSDIVIEVDNLWKKYRLGTLGTGTFRHDFNRWWHKIRGKQDPYAKVGEALGAGNHKSATKSPTSDLRPLISKLSSDLPSSTSHLPPHEQPSDLASDEMWALRGVSFQVKRGEILGIIGRNGAGKSTLLKILSRVTKPTNGEVRVRGRVASLLEVGTGFHPELTGRENIFLNGAILGMTKAEIKQNLDEIIAFAEIAKFLDTPVKRYSSGMYVRLAFAVAAHLDPEILIVDEVLAVGDAQFQNKCLGKMQDISTKEGRTVIFVSHNMATVRQLCSGGMLLSIGTTLYSGTTTNAINLYLRSCTPNNSSRSKHNGTGFEQFNLVDGDNNLVESLLAGQLIFVQLSMRISLDRRVQAGFTIFNQMDVPLMSSAALDSGLTFGHGRHSFRVRLPTELFAAGRYRIEGAVYDAHETYHQSDRLYEFDVIASTSHEASGMLYRGYIVMKEHWEPAATTFAN